MSKWTTFAKECTTQSYPSKNGKTVYLILILMKNYDFVVSLVISQPIQYVIKVNYQYVALCLSAKLSRMVGWVLGREYNCACVVVYINSERLNIV
jgi:hypothetical protein